MQNQLRIKTKRITLRSLSMEDSQSIYEYAKNINVSRYVTWDYHKNKEETSDYLKRTISLYKYFPTSNLGITLNDNTKDQIIGTVGLFQRSPISPYTYELGYVLGENWWGNGYALEAVNALITISFAHYKIERVQAYCIIENVQSYRLMEKIGMKREGLLRNFFFKNEIFYDVYIYSLLKKEWNEFR